MRVGEFEETCQRVCEDDCEIEWKIKIVLVAYGRLDEYGSKMFEDAGNLIFNG